MARGRYVAVGRVGRSHGVHGEVRVDPQGGLPRGLEGYTRCYLGRGRSVRPIEVANHRIHGRFLLVKFAECDSLETAKRLTGSTLYVDRAEMPELENGEYYHADLPGCRVVDESGKCLGRVEDVFASGAHDILVVASEGREWMLPVVSEYVISMEVDRETIVARVPEGLKG